MLNQDQKTEAKQNQTNAAARQVRPHVCPEAVLALLRARSAIDYYGNDSRMDEKFQSPDQGVRWCGLNSADLIFKLGRIIVSREVQATLTAEEISFCLDCHRSSIGQEVGEYARVTVTLRKSLASPFYLFKHLERKYGKSPRMVWVLTNSHCTRTVMRCRDEILFVKRKRARLSSMNAGQRREEKRRRDRFGR